MKQIKLRVIKIYYIFFILLILLIILACPGPLYYECGGQEYFCTAIFNTAPYENPIQYDPYRDIVLFADGTVISGGMESNESMDIYNLREICFCDTVNQLIFSMEHIIAVTPTKLCKLDSAFVLIDEFGLIGNDSTILINATRGDKDAYDNLYIIDSGDNSVKIYNYNGTFQNRWAFDQCPRELKYCGNIWIVNGAGNNINAYELNGDFLHTVFYDFNHYDIMTFSPSLVGNSWVVDLGGKRITLFINGKLTAEHAFSFCYMDVYLEFGEIVSVSKDFAFYFVDYENNNILSFDHNWRY